MFDTMRLGASAAGAYEIDRSVRIDAATGSGKFTRTFGTNSSDTTKTISFWLKQGTIGGTQTLFATTSDGYIESRLDFLSDGTMQFADRDSSSGSSDLVKQTSRRYKDISSWYHIVIIIDTTNVTAGDRIRIYTNGVRETAFLTDTNPAQNYAVQMFRSGVSNFIGANNTNNYVQLYLTEIHFLDGTIKEPDKFGERSATTGQWIPIKYTDGGYGTNGFYMNFSDNSNNTAATIGADTSGQGNNWTPTNISVTAGNEDDSMIDTPTNNFCTLNNADRSDHTTGHMAVTNGNLRVTYNYKPASKTFRTTMALPASGKFYWEWENEGTSPGRWNTGIVRYTSETESYDVQAYNDVDYVNTSYGGSFWSGTNNISDPGNGWSSWPTFYSGERMAYAVNMTNGKYWVGKVASGGGTTWYAADSGTDGDPVAGTNETGTIPNNGTGKWMPYIGWHDGGGADTTAFTCNINFGQHSFLGTKPAGFETLSSKNLTDPTILKGTDYFNAHGYTGNSSTNAVTGVGFAPNLVWVKNRDDTDWHAVFDTVRGVGKPLYTNNTDAEDSVATSLTAFGTDGFTLGSHGNANQNTEDYIAWCWKESATAGMDIVSYTGTGSTPQTRAHSLGVAPEMIIVKSRSGTDGDEHWVTYHHRNQTTSASSAQYFARLNTNGAFEDNTIWNDTVPTSSVFTTANNAIINANTKTFIAYLFAGVEGYSQFGRYVGTGMQANGPFIYTGFEPQFLLVKKVDSAYWHIHDNFRNPHNPRNAPLYPNDTPADEYYNLGNAASLVVDFHSNGFRPWTTHSEYNNSGSAYIYGAFAERPFKYSNAA